MRFDRPGHTHLCTPFFSGPYLEEALPKDLLSDTLGGQEALAYKGILRWSLITIVIPVLHTRIPPAPNQDVSNSPILLIALLVYVRLDVSFEQQGKIVYHVSLLLRLFTPFLYCLFIIPVHFGTTNLPGASVPHNLARQVRTLSIVRHPELIALYASAPNHVLGQ